MAKPPPLTIRSGTLTINGGNTGDNVIDIDSLAANYLANLTIVAGSGSDTVNVNGAVSLDNRDLTITADTILVGTAISTGGGDVTLSSTGDIALDDAVTTSGGGFIADADSDEDGSGVFSLSEMIPAGFAEQQRVNASDATSGEYFGVSVSH